ncbi:MAG: hypothetical protein F6J90_14200 [Moorea sp. SIOASIH]|uniref:hypothetical protein n=1 Tax=Moorena sp. SIOASIH TaxID=2607817 RepID=UPI0013BDB131|nr:hypothetical protein [Moorena sp. SIOASIH]NEO37414.1 hypothetical protein [Moorena sp. SIOASIH]
MYLRSLHGVADLTRDLAISRSPHTSNTSLSFPTPYSLLPAPLPLKLINFSNAINNLSIDSEQMRG